MSQRDVQDTPRAHGDVLTAISDGMVALLKEYYGRGPTRTKSYLRASQPQAPLVALDVRDSVAPPVGALLRLAGEGRVP